MNKENEKNLSKYISYILRHNPDDIGIKADIYGYVSVEELINKSKEKYIFTLEDLIQVVKNSDKKRFEFNEDNTRIKARQGHSYEVDLEVTSQAPLAVLYHGTANQNVESILKNGINSMNRQYVHLSSDIKTAYNVGQRHGKVIIFKIDAESMHKDGYIFYLTKNNVWLTKYISTKYISINS